MRSSKVKYISTSKTEAFTMVTSHPLLRKMPNFVMRRGPTCINHPWESQQLNLTLTVSEKSYRDQSCENPKWSPENGTFHPMISWVYNNHDYEILLYTFSLGIFMIQ